VIATTLAAEGVAIVVHGRDPKRTTAVAERITAMGGTASTAIGDLATDRSELAGRHHQAAPLPNTTKAELGCKRRETWISPGQGHRAIAAGGGFA
jgi:hypothetical protein